jgi:hypothetical protein
METDRAAGMLVCVPCDVQEAAFFLPLREAGGGTVATGQFEGVAYVDHGDGYHPTP